MNAPTPHVNEQIANVDDLKLFQPGKIGSIEVKNRVVMAPLTRCRSDEVAGDIPGSDMNIPADVLRVGAQWQSDMRTMLGLPPPAPLAERPVLLLTRKNGPSWLNRDDVVSELRQRVRSRGLKFVDAGHAEDLGRELLTSGWKVRKVRAGRGSEAGVRIGGQRSHRRRSKKPASARARATLTSATGAVFTMAISALTDSPLILSSQGVTVAVQTSPFAVRSAGTVNASARSSTGSPLRAQATV